MDILNNEMNNKNESWGSVSREQLDSILKSLQTGNGTYGSSAPTALTNGTAMMMESLDSSLKLVTFDMKHLKLWPLIAKDRAYSTVEQYNRQTSYGESTNGAFFDADAGTAPNEQTSAYNRQLQVVRYMGTTRVVSHPMTLVNVAHGPIIAKEIKNGTAFLLSNMERNLFEANGFFTNASGLFDGDTADLPTNSAKFNGLEQQIRFGNTDTEAKYTGFEGYGDTQSVVFDLEGSAPSEDTLEDSCKIALENHGQPNTLFIDHTTHSGLGKLFFPKERVNAMGVANGHAGFVLNKFTTCAGEISIVGDTFLRPKQAPLTVAHTGAPTAPTISLGVTADANSNLSATTYYYKVSALNNSGESVGSSQGSQVVASGERVQITITGTTGALYYAAYRSTTSGSGWQFIGYVADTNASGGAGATFNDAGNKVGGLPTGYLLTLDQDHIIWKQLAPMMKMDLAITGPAYRWMQMIYGTPIVYNPLHHVLIDNIGRA